MANYILNPCYGDMSVIVLGSSLKAIKTKLKKHWIDQLNNPEEYGEEIMNNIKFILNKEYSSIDELRDDYNKLKTEDYIFQQAR